MELDLENQFADRAYPILASLVTPRPIAFVTDTQTLIDDPFANHLNPAWHNMT
jgi:hypothetical protein